MSVQVSSKLRSKNKPIPHFQRANILLNPEQAKSPTLKRLKSAGFKLETDLAEIGLVTGLIPEGTLEKFRAIDGVATIEGDTQVSLSPPDSPIQ